MKQKCAVKRNGRPGFRGGNETQTSTPAFARWGHRMAAQIIVVLLILLATLWGGRVLEGAATRVFSHHVQEIEKLAD